jgi:hypothetical protein
MIIRSRSEKKKILLTAFWLKKNKIIKGFFTFVKIIV